MDDPQSQGACCENVSDTRYRNEYKVFMDQEFKVDNFDILLLCNEEDTEKAREFQDKLQTSLKICMGGKPRPPIVEIESEFIADGCEFTRLDHAFEKSVYIFLLCTKNFCKEDLDLLKAYGCLIKALYKRKGDAKWCVVPVFTEKRPKAELPVPLNALRSITYYGNFYDPSAVSKLLESKASVRQDLDDKLEAKRKEFFEENKNRILQRAKQFQNCPGVDVDLTDVKRLEPDISQNTNRITSTENQDELSYTDRPTNSRDTCLRDPEVQTYEKKILPPITSDNVMCPQSAKKFESGRGCDLLAADTSPKHATNSNPSEHLTVNTRCARVTSPCDTHNHISKVLGCSLEALTFVEDYFSNDSTSSVEVQPPSSLLPPQSIGWNIPIDDEPLSISDNSSFSTELQWPTAPNNGVIRGASSVTKLSRTHHTRPVSTFKDQQKRCKVTPDNFDSCKNDGVAKFHHRHHQLHHHHHHHAHHHDIDEVDDVAAEMNHVINLPHNSDSLARENKSSNLSSLIQFRKGL